MMGTLVPETEMPLWSDSAVYCPSALTAHHSPSPSIRCWAVLCGGQIQRGALLIQVPHRWMVEVRLMTCLHRHWPLWQREGALGRLPVSSSVLQPEVT